jgi:hypothetical protein
MYLTKLSTGDIGLDKPTEFAIYSVEGKLLLQTGQVVSSEGLLERLYRLGYREGTAPAPRAAAKSSARPAPATGTTEDNGQLLFGTAHLPEGSSPVNPMLTARSAALPNLAQKVEFFQLTGAGSESVRVELAGVVGDKALIARLPEGQALQPGVEYDAQLFTGTRLFKFVTQLLPEAAGPFGCVYLAYPSSVAQASVRKQQRVATEFPGKLLSGEYQRPVADVTVENMSSTGAAVLSTEDLLTVGQSARLSMTLSIESRLRPITVFVEVRNRRREGERFRYGLQFVRVPDEVRREIKDFILDRMSLQ